MKLFLIQLGEMVPAQVDVARMLKKNHEIQYWVRMENHFAVYREEFEGTFFQDYLDAIQGIPARGIDLYKYEPWSAHDIAAYGDIESEYMTMADKLHPHWSVNQRKDLYFDLLRYWGGILDEFKPDCIVILGVPHHEYDFVLYKIAKRRGIRTIILENTFRGGRYVLYEDYTVGSEKFLIGNGARETTLEQLSPEMRAYFERVSLGENPAPPYVQAFHERRTTINAIRRWNHAIVRFIKDRSLFERAILKVLKMMKPSLKDEHHANEKAPNFDNSYAYFPLHYQPEFTTSPAGGLYVDQMHAIKTIAAALPEGWELYVKEHPGQLAVHGGNFTPARYSGFYSAIVAIPHVRLVPLETNTYKLIDRARTTATIAGTAGWESYLDRVDQASLYGDLLYIKTDTPQYAQDMYTAIEEMLAS